MGESKLTIHCPLCGAGILVPFTVMSSDRRSNMVDVRLSTDGPLRDHLSECAEKAGDQVGQTLNQALGRVSTPAAPAPSPELAGRIDRLLAILEENGELTRGDRGCTMCGTKNADCVRGVNNVTGVLRKTRHPGAPCCQACGQGNTHPTGGERTPCAEWGAEHGAQN